MNGIGRGAFNLWRFRAYTMMFGGINWIWCYWGPFAKYIRSCGVIAKFRFRPHCALLASTRVLSTRKGSSPLNSIGVKDIWFQAQTPHWMINLPSTVVSEGGVSGVWTMTLSFDGQTHGISETEMVPPRYEMALASSIEKQEISSWYIEGGQGRREIMLLVYQELNGNWRCWGGVMSSSCVDVAARSQGKFELLDSGRIRS